MIVTGGKNGDVGLHDFRFIATGKMKKQRNPDGGSSTDGDQNKNGMLWYIPKAHLGAHPKAYFHLHIPILPEKYPEI